MALISLKYSEGTIANPQHTKSSEACFLAEGTNLVHFPDGKLTPIPSFVDALYNGSSLAGQCRAIHAAELITANYAGAHYLFGTHSKVMRSFKQKMANVTPLKTVAEATLGSNPIAVVNASPIITVTYAAHGLSVGDRIKLIGATSAGGILATSINIEHIVASVPNANTFTIVAASNASSTTTGGGASVQILKEIASGNPYQDFLSGFGAGVFNAGNFSQSQTSNAGFLYPRIWSFDNFRQSVVMCAGDYEAGDGQKIYIWDGDDKVAPQVLANAPTNANWVLTVNESVIALCGNEIVISQATDATIWTGANTYRFEIQRANRLLSGVAYGSKSAIIFAPDPYLLTDLGSTWDLQSLGQAFAIIAPRAFCKFNDGILWYGADHKIYFFNGTTVETMVNPQNGEYIKGRLDRNNAWTSFMFADPKHDQAWFYYPSIGNQNPDEYVIFNPRRYAGDAPPSFTTGRQGRTAAQNVMIQGTYHMANAAAVYSAFSNESRNFAWEAQTAAFYVDGTNRYKANYIIPDFVQTNNINLNVKTLKEPQTDFIDYGDYTIPPKTRRVAVRGAGKLFSFKFSGSGDAMLNALQIEMQKQGEAG